LAIDYQFKLKSLGKVSLTIPGMIAFGNLQQQQQQDRSNL
jgi:hypothetical protein